MGFPNSPSLTMSMPASTWRRTTSATALASAGSSCRAGAFSRCNSRSSEGRERLPTWVVRMRSVVRFMSWLSSGPIADGGAGLSFGSARALGFALIVKLLALGQRHFALDPAVLQVDFGGNQRQPLFAGLAQQFVDFPAVQQELAIADGRMVLAVAVRILADMGVYQPGFIV